MLFSIASVFLMFLIGLVFTPLHCLPPTFPLFLMIASCDSESCTHRLWTSYPILDLVCDFSSAGTQPGSLDSLSSGLVFLILDLPRLSLSQVPFAFLHNYTNTPPFFSCNSFSSSFLKSLVKGKGYCGNMGWAVVLIKLVPYSPLASLSSCSLWASTQHTVLLSCQLSFSVSPPPLCSSSLSYHFSIQ